MNALDLARDVKVDRPAVAQPRDHLGRHQELACKRIGFGLVVALSFVSAS